MRRRLALPGALLAAALLPAACSSADRVGPLGDGGTPGQQCIPGRQGQPQTMGIFDLHDTGTTTVKVTGISLPSAHGLRMTKSAWLIPIWVTQGTFNLVGAGYGYPPVTWATWKDHRPAIGAVIKPHQDLNLVFGLIRTTGRSGTSAGPAITYTAGGSTYTVHEQTSLVVTARRTC
jgi:hypothetical protein